MTSKVLDSPLVTTGRVLLAAGMAALAWGAFAKGASLEVNCAVRLVSQNCSFTNLNRIVPAAQCLRVRVIKVSGDEGEAKAGANAISAHVCSGWLLGQTTKTVDIPSFDRNIVSMCGELKNCAIKIEEVTEADPAVGLVGRSGSPLIPDAAAGNGVTKAGDAVPVDEREPRCTYSADGIKLFCK